MKDLGIRASIVFVSILSFVACSEDTLIFPELTPAAVRILNATQDADTLAITIDSVQTILVARTAFTQPITIASGRRVPFVFAYRGQPIGRDTAFFTLGSAARIFLVSRGSHRRIVRFLPPITDTLLPPGTLNAFVKFCHAAEPDYVDQFYTLELWRSGAVTERLLPTSFDPDQTSRSWHALAPGTYTFEARIARGGRVAASTSPVELVAGKSYLIYTIDVAPPAIDNIKLVVE
jgi:hypothetical protein